jgi:uncharacterized protein (TIGR02001 family)
MLTSIRSLMAATALAGGILLASPALAQDAPAEEAAPAITISGNVALVTDYRFRGVSLSGGDPAVQGGITVSHASGFYLGAWSSSIEGGALYGEQELDLFGGWSGNVASGTKVDVGILKYVYPTNDVGPADYWEPYASIAQTFGPATAKFGVAYAWEQDSLGGDDNLYLYTNLDIGVPQTPITVSGHLGYTDGVLSPSLLAGGTDDQGWDWSVGASATVFGHLTAGVSYVGVDGPSIDGFTDDTIVGTLTLSL